MAGSVRRALREGPVFLFGLTRIARRVFLQGLTYLAPTKLRRIERASREIEHRSVAGDILEFGVAAGGSAIILAAHARRFGRRFIGFDVFAQIPPPASEHDDERSRQRFEVIKSGSSKGIRGNPYYGYQEDLLGKVKAAFARYGIDVDGSDVSLVEGLFEQTWPQQSIAAVALAHIDCDWYDPVKYCLEAIADRLSVGGMIVIDDYNDYGGCRTAVDQFLAARGDFRFEAGPNPILRRIERQPG